MYIKTKELLEDFFEKGTSYCGRQVLDMGLFGVALSGAPICGSTNGTSALDNLASLDDEQLCVRWYQMGLLMPLAHSLSRLDQRPRAPVDWSAGGRKIVANAIQLRYRLLAHFYTLLYQVSRRTRSRLARPNSVEQADVAALLITSAALTYSEHETWF